jgi:glycosyltransferase involved in cell wall biosynthesis
MYGAVAAGLCGASLVSTRHNDDVFRRRWPSRALHRVLTAAADRLITISDALQRFVVDTEGAAPEKVRRVHYGLDVPAPAAPTRRPAGRPGRVIGVVGRLTVQKGHRYLLRALVRVRQKCDDVRLVMVGDGPLAETLVGEARHLGVADIVEFMGHRNDAAALMSVFDVVVVPSLWEGFGLVLLEAMAAGRPIIASRVSAIPEIVVDGETGILVPPADPESLSHAIVRLLDDADLADRMGRQGRARLVRVFSVDAMVAGTEAVYDEVIAMNERRG